MIYVFSKLLRAKNNSHRQRRSCLHMNIKRATTLRNKAALHALELVGSKGWVLITQVTTVCILAVSQVFGLLLYAIP